MTEEPRTAGPGLLLGGILLIGLVVRLLWINALGFNSDEAVYAGQAASIAGDTQLFPYFPIFRAHPLLFQTTLSLFYQFGTSDVLGRLVSVGFGEATIALTYLLGRTLYGRAVGLLAALLIAVMPYQVVVTRQVLLDGPLVTFSTLTLLLAAKYGATRRAVWLVATGGALGLTCLTKETGALLVGSIYAFLALTQQLGTRVRTALLALGGWLLVFAPYPLSLKFAKRGDTGQNFLAWQLFRRPNHDWKFYAEVVPPALGWGVVAAVVVALVLARTRWTWRETLLICWVAVPIVVFEIWAVKGFQYLLPISTPVAVLAAVGTIRLALMVRRWRVPVAAALVAAVVVSCLLPTIARIRPSESDTFLAGSGGVPGGRETGAWIRDNIPEGAQMLALGPSMANIIEFYGQRRVYGLSVSTNPLNRNPSYQPIANPDLAIRRNTLQYIVWDSYSAGRSPFYSGKLKRYVERYNGRAIHTESVLVKGRDGQTVSKPVIVVYEVRP
ncbi:MAG: phospholipid carrier-dependent glycosyltransferase [Nocardioidaceae bacterium]|nr:phospholipid carrier-dependent glycosyltransferase [Nocardioidaceae bacterium]